MATRQKPLDISYSLRLGPSTYHVLGKRRESRRTKYDYYVIDEKLIRSKSNQRPVRPRYIVDESKKKLRKSSRAHSPDKSTVVSIEQIKHAVAETMETAQEKLVVALRATIVKENEAATEVNQKRDNHMVSRVRRTIRETLRAQNNSSEAMEKLEQRLVQTIKQELETARSETLSAVLAQQQEQASIASADHIQAAVTRALESQQNQHGQSVRKQDIQELENTLSGKIQEMVDRYKTIKIHNDLDTRTSSYGDLNERKQTQQRQESSSNQSSIKTKQSPTNTFTQGQSGISHKRDEEVESQKSTA